MLQPEGTRSAGHWGKEQEPGKFWLQAQSSGVRAHQGRFPSKAGMMLTGIRGPASTEEATRATWDGHPKH